MIVKRPRARMSVLLSSLVRENIIYSMKYFQECYSSCPCFRYCPSGCEGCPNSICLCMTKCPTDCSCKNGYSCQPHVTVICQSQAYNIENLGYASFNYIISADGEFKVLFSKSLSFYIYIFRQIVNLTSLKKGQILIWKDPGMHCSKEKFISLAQ